jgi:hypothetical protein
MRAARALLLCGASLAAWLPAGRAGAEEPDAKAAAAAARALRRLETAPRPYFRALTTLAFGSGLRFNNPYRLQTQLGDDAESLSVTAPYVDLGLGITVGPPDGLQHGAALHLSLALAGVAQQTLTPSYQALYRGGQLMFYGRFGSPILISPDVNLGFELAGGLAWFLTGAVGLNAELVGDLFYGAATREATYTVYPILSAQLGVAVDFEALP